MYSNDSNAKVVDSSISHGIAENREESKLNQLKSLLIEIRESNYSLSSRTREFKTFLCGNYPEREDLVKNEKRDEPNGELSLLLEIARDVFDSVQISHEHLNQLEKQIRP